MKKIVYTITFHRADNYGAMIQAYALQKKISEKYETYILDYDNKYISNLYRIFRGNDTNVFRDIYHFFKNIFFYKKDKLRHDNFIKFRKKLQMTPYFKNKNEVYNFFDNKDCIYVVGSDQVWNTKITHGFDEIYTLGFASKKSRRIAYAASSGKTSILKENEQLFINNLKLFNSISVREKNMKEYLTSKLKQDILVSLDPSLLLTKKQWEDFSGKERVEKDKYIFAYSVGNANDLFYETVNKISKLTGLKIIYFDKNKKKVKFDNESVSYYSCGPIEFVNLLKNSEYVITTSFHGTALSIILNKEFYTVLSSLPDRLTTLLNKVELENRIINKEYDFSNIISDRINWNNVNEKIKAERQISEKWLFKAIEGDKNE